MTARSMIGMFLTSLVLLMLSLSVSRAETTQTAPPVFALRLSGYYFNFFGGLVALDSTVKVEANDRHGPGKFVDQGGDGGFYGFRLGYGQATGMWYLGGELEGIFLNNVRSRLDAFGVEYRARLQNEAGAYFRAGYSPDGTWLMYGRLGVSVPRQLFDVEGSRSSRRWEVTPNIGVGAEFVTASGFGLRFDWTYGFPTGANIIETYRAAFAVTYYF